MSLWSASAQSVDSHEDQRCKTCTECNNVIVQLQSDFDSAAGSNLRGFVRELDRDHLPGFIGSLAPEISAKAGSISTDAIRNEYMPALAAAIEAMATYEKLPDMSMERQNMIGRYDWMTAPDDRLRFMLYEFCMISSYMSIYIQHADTAKQLGIETFMYNDLHYIEYWLYGNDLYMSERDPAPDGVYMKLWTAFEQYIDSKDFENTRLEFIISNAVNMAFSEEQYDLILDNARDICKLSLYILPNHYQSGVGEILNNVAGILGKQREITAIMTEETTARSCGTEMIELYNTQNEINATDSQTLLDFESYRNDLKDNGYKFAGYWAWNCPGEYIDDIEIYSQYSIACARLMAETWKDIKKLYGIPNYRATIQRILDYFACSTIEEFAAMSCYMAYDIFFSGDTTLALDILDPALFHYKLVPHTFAPYHMISVASIYVQLGNSERLKEILYDHILPYLEVCDYKEQFLYKDIEMSVFAAILHSRINGTPADDLLDKAAELSDRLDDDEEKVYILGLICDAYFEGNAFDRGKNIVEKCLQYDMPEYQRAWISLGGSEIYYHEQSWEKALANYKAYGEEYEDLLSETFFVKMMSCAAHMHDEQAMRQLADKYIGSIRAQIKDMLFCLSTEEREELWHQTDNGNLFAEIWECSKNDTAARSITAQCLFDYNLTGKGLLLDADNRIDRWLVSHPDSIVRRRYTQMKDLAARLDKITLHGGDPVQVEFLNSSLQNARNDITFVVRQSGIGNDAASDLSYSWQQVRDRLDQREAAIEFVRLGTEKDDDPLYVAVVVRKEWHSPRIVELCRESTLRQYAHGDTLSNRILYNTMRSSELWNIIWEPLQECISDGDRIYFSADGLLHMLDIESIRSRSDRRLADERYDLRRLSSTRELCKDRQRARMVSAMLYGGLNYRMEDEAMSQAASRYTSPRQEGSHRLTRGTAAAADVPRTELPQTLEEAEAIASMLRSSGVTATVISGDEAIEESFKSLSGKRFELLHIATHGFYIEGRTGYQSSDESLSPMMRAGLVMSSKERAGTDDREDGLLLAREIADMDLSAVDMVVLSACQTAQGDITGDGVFGLQRGFKQAGVGTIVMTMWEVDSEMTQYMMTEFYRALAGGAERREAFRRARTAARELYPTLDWAAFVMLD